MTWVNGDELLREDGNGEDVGTTDNRSCSFWFEYNVFEKNYAIEAFYWFLMKIN